MRALLNWWGALVGLLLILTGGLLQPALPWWSSQAGFSFHDLPITAQVPALLLTALVCGPRSGMLAAVAYLSLGLSVIPVFQEGGGLAYLQQPSFGYLAGFIPAAWLCGRLAKQSGMDSLERLTGTACLGVLTIQLCGLLNLGLGSLARRWGESLPQLLITYSLMPLPAQLLLCCVVGVMARFLRPLLLVNR
ncbi:MAG: biotin transporter BioY [Synechococcaceae bacterium WB6_3A_227]|nr:biotin transporter BioY [Synechococcaceae bacterium WB6_3A_227]